MSRLRLGVVLLVAGAAGHQIDGLRRALGDGSYERIPTHITLVPPVNVNQAELGTAFEVLRAAVSESGPLRLEIGPVASFWPDTPVVYLAVGGDLEGLGRLRDRVFSGPFARPLTWPFVPHVTLAEDVEPGRIPVLTECLASYRTQVTVDRVHLLRERDGRRWEALADVALGPPAVRGRGGLEIEVHVADHLDPEAAAWFRDAWEAHRARSYGELPPAKPFAVTVRREGSVVGVALGDSDDDLRLERLVVDPASASQGIGSHALAASEDLGRHRGCRRAVLVCRVGTARWYTERGWRIAQELPRWTHDADFVRMEKAL